MKIFKRNFTKWIPIVIYDYEGNKILLLGRMNTKSGMPHFKCKKLHRRFDLNRNISTTIFDASEQFKKLFQS